MQRSYGNSDRDDDKKGQTQSDEVLAESIFKSALIGETLEEPVNPNAGIIINMAKECSINAPMPLFIIPFDFVAVAVHHAPVLQVEAGMV